LHRQRRSVSRKNRPLLSGGKRKRKEGDASSETADRTRGDERFIRCIGTFVKGQKKIYFLARALQLLCNSKILGEKKVDQASFHNLKGEQKRKRT